MTVVDTSSPGPGVGATPTTGRLGLDTPTDLGATLGAYPRGAGDPTTVISRTGRGRRSSGRFTRATLTPDGPGTLHLRWSAGVVVDAEVWGPGGQWLLARIPDLVGASDPGAPELERAAHPVVADAARHGRLTRLGASGTLYHELLPTILEQRITSGEAKRQWRRLCCELGEPAPGPADDLLLPPRPEQLARRPSWWFHPLGVERARAEPLSHVARHATKLWSWAELPPSEAGRKLRLLPGIGVWTTGVVLARALADPDAVPVGDYHVKNIVGHALAGEARATDERMLELLEPYRGQRGRVVRLLKAAGHGAPKYGPRRRILPMARW